VDAAGLEFRKKPIPLSLCGRAGQDRDAQEGGDLPGEIGTLTIFGDYSLDVAWKIERRRKPLAPRAQPLASPRANPKSNFLSVIRSLLWN
jgi:hypothetical protein